MASLFSYSAVPVFRAAGIGKVTAFSGLSAAASEHCSIVDCVSKATQTEFVTYYFTSTFVS
jgi:hypothetical protein